MNGKIKWFNIIRVAGLSLVLIYHFYGDRLPGGFLGVDVFYTFSGYLITALIIEEVSKSSRFDLPDFYKRRFLRLFPVLLIMIIITLPLALMISSDFSVNIGKQAAAALSFVTNYYEVLTGGSYEAQMLPHLYVHTWFLAAEAHFYLIWGLLCALASRDLRIKYSNAPKRGINALRRRLYLISCALAATSYANMQILYAGNPADPSAAYFSTTARAFPFLIGAAAASLLGMRMRDNQIEIIKSKPARMFAFVTLPAAIIIIVIMAASYNFNSAAIYRFGILLVSILTVAAVYAARILHEATPEHVNEPAIIAMFADLSYSIYLFHWPVYIVFSQMADNNMLASLSALTVSLLISLVVRNVIEPIIMKKPKPGNLGDSARLKPALAAACAACVSLSFAAIHRAPEISALEREMNIGYIYQDADAVRDHANAYIALAAQGQPEEIAGIARPVMTELPVSGAEPQAVPNATPAAPENMEVFIIGDSVCLGARSDLRKKIPNCTVDATGSRSISDGYSILMEMQDEGSLSECVVVALGTNVTNDVYSKIDRIIENINPGHRLIFVTPYNGSISQNTITYKTMEYMRTLPDQFPFVTVADWAGIIESQKELLGSDKLHIGGNTKAKNVYVNCIIDAIAEAAEKPAKP